MGGAHISLRLDDSLIERVKNLKTDKETVSEAYRRVLIVGCNTLERGTGEAQNDANGAQGSTRNTDGAQVEAQDGAQGSTFALEVLKAEIVRLEAEHEADRAAIAQKDAQIARALEKAHELAEQAHILMGINSQQVDKLPAVEIVEDEKQEQEQETEQEPEKEPEKPRGFFARLFGL